MSKKVLRLLYPQWQGGTFPSYIYASQLLNFILPKGNNTETIEAPVNLELDKQEKSNGVKNEKILLKQIENTYNLLEIKNPEKIVTLGGDCGVSQAPFDYLHSKYPELGIIWIDAHPDIQQPTEKMDLEFAMIMGNLLGDGAPQFAKIVKHPFKYNELMLAGFIKKNCLKFEKEYIEEKKIRYATPQDLEKDSSPIINWIKENKFKHLCIHLDLDVLSPKYFMSNVYHMPNPPKFDFEPAVGELDLKTVTRIINDAGKEAEMVGFSIAEYFPWDILHMREEFSKIDILNE